MLRRGARTPSTAPARGPALRFHSERDTDHSSKLWALAPHLHIWQNWTIHCKRGYFKDHARSSTVAAQISGCLADISAWMKEHHLQLNLAKTELLVFPAPPTLQHDFTIQLGSSTITHSTSVRNLGVIFNDQLTFKENIAKTARSCRFALHNIRKIRPFLTEHAAQLLVQALVISRLDYCNALLAGLPSNTIKPLQMIQNAAARLVFNEPKRAHVTPLFISLHWLTGAALIKFKTLMLAYRTTTGSAPSYFHSLLRIYIPSRSPAYFHSLLRIYIPLQKPRLLPLTITNLHPLQKPRLLPLTITNLHPLQKPRLLPLTITNLHPLQKPRLLPFTITNLRPLQKPRLLPLTITNLRPLQKPRLLTLTIMNLHPLQKPRLIPLTIPNLHPFQKSEIC